MKPNLSADFTLPEWVPDVVRLYLDHTGEGIPIRELARREGTHASTIMRRVRRCELRRDDPLVDEALQMLCDESHDCPKEESSQMTVNFRQKNTPINESMLHAEAQRVLRRLAEPGAILAVAHDMEKAIVTRKLENNETARSCVLDRNVAQAFALKDWISCSKQGRIATYVITPAGRAALKRFGVQNTPPGLAEAPSTFSGQHKVWETRTVVEDGAPRRVRCNAAESPIAVLGRRRDKNGSPFLESSLIQAAERLREDFEVAQMGPRVAQNWERFLTGGGSSGTFRADKGPCEGPSKARERVAAALRDLGPGLGDVALRVCCFLEGIETAERRMGWAARSGKIVLRIALQRLKRHYDESRQAGTDLMG